MNRTKINFITITLKIFFLIGALLFGYLEHMVSFKAWIVYLVCLILMFIVGIVRAALLKSDKNKTIKSNTIRVVSVKPTEIKGKNVSTPSITDELPLVHVDNVDSKKVVIKLYKSKVLLTDSIGRIVGQ